MDFFSAIAGSLTTTAITGFVFFLARDRISTWFRLKADLELTRVKTELESGAEKTNIKYGQLAARRIEVIADVFGAMKKTQSSMGQLASPGGQVWVAKEDYLDPKKFSEALRAQRVEQFNRAVSDFNEFIKLFDSNRLFLPVNACEQIDNLIKELRNVHFEMETALDEDQWGSTEKKERRKMKQDAWERVTNSIPEIADKLEARFRELTGADKA